MGVWPGGHVCVSFVMLCWYTDPQVPDATMTHSVLMAVDGVGAKPVVKYKVNVRSREEG